MRYLLPLLAVMVLTATPVLAQSEAEVDARLDTVMGDHQPFKAAFEAIQAAVAADDAATLSEYISYDAPTMIDGEPVTFESKEDFEAAYSDLITDDFIAAVVGQRYEDLFVNSDGVMFGNGQLWLNGICADDACSSFEVKIITIQSTAS